MKKLPKPKNVINKDDLIVGVGKKGLALARKDNKASRIMSQGFRVGRIYSQILYDELQGLINVNNSGLKAKLPKVEDFYSRLREANAKDFNIALDKYIRDHE